MKVGYRIVLLHASPINDEIEIQAFETMSGELIDSAASIGIVAEDVLVPTFAIDIEAEKLRKFLK